MIMGNVDYVSALIAISAKDIPEVQKEAVWALSNATKNSNTIQIAQMIEMEVLDCFIALLSSEDSKIVEVVLEGVNNILNWGAYAALQNNSTENEFLIILENKGGVAKIEQLQVHPNTEVYAKALKILEAHFELESVL